MSLGPLPAAVIIQVPWLPSSEHGFVHPIAPEGRPAIQVAKIHHIRRSKQLPPSIRARVLSQTATRLHLLCLKQTVDKFVTGQYISILFQPLLQSQTHACPFARRPSVSKSTTGTPSSSIRFSTTVCPQQAWLNRFPSKGLKDYHWNTIQQYLFQLHCLPTASMLEQISVIRPKTMSHASLESENGTQPSVKGLGFRV